MANRLQKLLYFLSAEAPVMVMAAVVWAVQKEVWVGSVVLTAIAVTLIILFNIAFIYAKKNLPSIPVKMSPHKKAAEKVSQNSSVWQ